MQGCQCLYAKEQGLTLFPIVCMNPLQSAQTMSGSKRTTEMTAGAARVKPETAARTREYFILMVGGSKLEDLEKYEAKKELTVGVWFKRAWGC